VLFTLNICLNLIYCDSLLKTEKFIILGRSVSISIKQSQIIYCAIISKPDKQFIEHINEDLLTGILVDSFKARWGKEPAEAEVRSWKNSLPEIKNLVEIAGLNDVIIVIEYEVPYNETRVDCMLFGTDRQRNENVVLLELKQWTKIIELEGNFSTDSEDKIQIYTGGADRVVVHPSQQVKGYHNTIVGNGCDYYNEKTKPFFDWYNQFHNIISE